MAINGFWTGERVNDPVMQFRFRVLINGEFVWWAKTCDKPKINIPVLGKDEYYLNSPLPDVKPGEIVDFQPITMTFIDPADPSAVKNILDKLSGASGGNFPRINPATLKENFNKTELTIQQIDHLGAALETWNFQGAFPTSIDFGSLDYGNSEFVEITMTWEYISFKATLGSPDGLQQRYWSSDPVRSSPASTADIKKLDGSYT